MTPSLISRVEMYRHFGESCCFHNLPECLGQQVFLKRRLTLTFNIFFLFVLPAKLVGNFV